MVKFFEIRKNESRLIYDSIEGIKQVLGKDNNNGPKWANILHEVDEVSSVMCSMSSVLYPNTMYSFM